MLAAQRTYPAVLAGCWEFPGGKVDPGETPETALRRECLEELAITVRVGTPIGDDVALVATAFAGRLRLFHCCLQDDSQVPRPSGSHASLRWLSANELADVPWLVTNRQLLPQVVTILAARA